MFKIPYEPCPNLSLQKYKPTNFTGLTSKKLLAPIKRIEELNQNELLLAWCCAIHGRGITRSKSFPKARLRRCSCWALRLAVRQLKQWSLSQFIFHSVRNTHYSIHGHKVLAWSVLPLTYFCQCLGLLSHMMTLSNLVLNINLYEVRGSFRVTI